MNSGAANYIIRTFIQKLLSLFFFLLGSWWVMTWQNWVFFGTVFVVTAISLTIVYLVNPDLLAERKKLVTDSPKWDKVLLLVFWLLNFFLIYLIAGLELGKTIPNSFFFWLGMALIIFSTIVSLAALVVNPYLESTARVQTDRGQKVISNGVYGVVRHPAYFAILLSNLAVALVFQTFFLYLAAVIIAIIVVVRTYLEDKMLKENLEGYLQYSQKIKYRLLPYIW